MAVIPYEKRIVIFGPHDQPQYERLLELLHNHGVKYMFGDGFKETMRNTYHSVCMDLDTMHLREECGITRICGGWIDGGFEGPERMISETTSNDDYYVKDGGFRFLEDMPYYLAFDMTGTLLFASKEFYKGERPNPFEYSRDGDRKIMSKLYKDLFDAITSNNGNAVTDVEEIVF